MNSDWIWAASWQNQQHGMCAQRRLRSAWASTQFDQSSMSAWKKLGALATHWAHSEDSDQTGRMPRLIWVFAGRTVIRLVLSWGGSYSLIAAEDRKGCNVTCSASTTVKVKVPLCGPEITFVSVGLPCRLVWISARLDTHLPNVYICGVTLQISLDFCKAGHSLA